MEKIKSPEKSARKLILQFLLANVGRVVEGRELRDAGKGITEWARRVRELRDEFGYQIQSHKDSSELKPGQYRLVSAKRIPAFSRAISKETRAVVTRAERVYVSDVRLGSRRSRSIFSWQNGSLNDGAH